MMAYTAAQQRRMQATEELANRLAAIRQEIEARSAAGVRPVAVPAPAGIDAGSLIGDRLRKSPQDYKNLTPYMRSLYNAAARRATPNVSLASAEKYPDTQRDTDRKASLSRMALVGPTIQEFGHMQRYDTTDPANRELVSKAEQDAKAAERTRFTPGSAYQQAVAKRRALQEAAQAKNYSKNMRSAYARGVLRPGAVSLGVQQGILPDEQGMAAARAIAMIQAGHPTRQPSPVDEVVAAQMKADPSLLRQYFGGGQTPDAQTGSSPAGTAPAGPAVGYPGSASALGGRLIESLPDGHDVYLMPNGLRRMERRGTPVPVLPSIPQGRFSGIDPSSVVFPSHS